MTILLVLAVILLAILIARMGHRFSELERRIEAGDRNRLEDRIRSLEQQVRQLQSAQQAAAAVPPAASVRTADTAPVPGKPAMEAVPPLIPAARRAIYALDDPAPRATPQSAPQSNEVQELPTVQAIPHAPRPVPAEPVPGRTEKPETAAHPVLSLEERLGENWLNKLGIASLVIGIAFFLAYRLQTMTPGGKVLTGVLVSLTLLGGGLWLERKQTYRLFAGAGIGGGWALLFFTAFAINHVPAARILDSLVWDLVLMLMVAAGMVLHSLRYRSQTVTGLAFGLGFVTLATSHFESAQGTVIFSLVASALLALGLVIVTTIRHWARLELAALVAVVASHFLWLGQVLPMARQNGQFPLFWQSTGLILFYWIIFRAAYLFRLPLDAEEDRLSSLTAVLAAAGILGLLKFQGVHPEWTFGALLALGFLEIALGIWKRPARRSAFLVLTTVGAALLVAAVPYQFHGVSWPVLWLVEAHVLALCGLRLGEPLFRRLGLLAGFGAALVVAFKDVVPVMLQRLKDSDPGHHPSLTMALTLAALLFWIHAEVYPQCFPEIVKQLGDAEILALKATGWLGLAAAATAIWVVLPSPTGSVWIAPVWLALVLLLGFIADWQSIVSLGLQADALALGSLIALAVWGAGAEIQDARLPWALCIALLYGGMRRRTVLENSPNYVALAYSWAASGLLVFWIGRVAAEEWMVLFWVVQALLLFELGMRFKRGYLRWQGILAALIAFSELELLWISQVNRSPGGHSWFALSASNFLCFAGSASLGYWFQERTRSMQHGHSAIERRFGLAFGAASSALVVCWLPLLIPNSDTFETYTLGWAIFSVVLLAVSQQTSRLVFQVHAIAVCTWTGMFGATLSIATGHRASGAHWWQQDLARMALVSAILLSGLPVAFRKKKEDRSPWWDATKWFFFVPYGLMIVTLASTLSRGNITLGWSLLGLAAFLFALAVHQRTYRLGGLALLLLSTVKILLMDVWTLEPSDRYITLIIMGCALLLVSYLYTRFRETFRKLL